MEKKSGHLTFESDNLAVPEVHTHEVEEVDELEEQKGKGQDEDTEIVFDNVAIPEIHFKNIKK